MATDVAVTRFATQVELDPIDRGNALRGIEALESIASDLEQIRVLFERYVNTMSPPVATQLNAAVSAIPREEP